jgi:hypothetical protein
MPGATPAGVPRAALARFAHLRSAAAARNTLHGVDFQPIAGPSCVVFCSRARGRQPDADAPQRRAAAAHALANGVPAARAGARDT